VAATSERLSSPSNNKVAPYVREIRQHQAEHDRAAEGREQDGGCVTLVAKSGFVA
jgi:hypothetical protein